jgi:hypothetical protein
VESKNAPANGETISGNNQNQHARRLKAAIAVLETWLFVVGVTVPTLEGIHAVCKCTAKPCLGSL